MFGRTKKTEQATEPLVNGWREADLSFLLKTLSNDEPRIGTIVTGYRQTLTLDGEPWAYNQKRTGLDRDDKLGLLLHKNEIVGQYGLRHRCRLEGSFAVCSNKHDYEQLQRGIIGRVSITCNDGCGNGLKTPLMLLHFVVRHETEQNSLQGALRGSLAGNGAYLNMICSQVEDIDDWLSAFREKGYSPSVPIKRIHIGAESGDGPFD